MTSRQKEGSVSLTLGSLCTGYGGLDLAVDAVLDTSPVWLSEIEAAPAQVCEVRFPDVPNLGDLTVLDWSQVPPVDVLTAGYPCQPFSHAGKREGTNDERHLWPYVAEAIRVLRPRIAVLENVAGHLSMGFGDVLRDLADIGFDVEWCVVRASDIGACHQRARLFIVATADPDLGRWAGREFLEVGGQGERAAVAGSGQDVPADSGGVGRGPRTGLREGEPGGERRQRPCDDSGTPAHPQGDTGRVGDRDGAAPADADGAGSEARDRRPGSGHAGRLQPVVADDAHAWGEFEPAIRQHERLVGRPAPLPVDDRGRLAPRFVEWMMCLPDGWVTDVLTNRSRALKCLGNGVVPPQAEYALRGLLARMIERPDPLIQWINEAADRRLAEDLEAMNG